MCLDESDLILHIHEANLQTGNGGLLGSWDSREEGKNIYTRTVEEAIARLSAYQGRNLGPDSPESIRVARLRRFAAEDTFGDALKADLRQ